ncbi:LysR family transcriptional regulator [Vibrio makurazakiensis]|uniref:LysR family transcriptional regulator n=1 Tax=Vibrio makurazakiensis TaxID=2910250 RepID=UPI003D136AFB
MNNLNDMMVFATVVEQGSFTAAAESMGLPKSNISRKISRLEENLGIRLLERSTRTQHLTEVGRQYYAFCQRIKEEVYSAEQAVETLLERPQGNLKICASLAIGQELLAQKLAEFNAKYPDIKIELSLTNRRVDIIEEGYDLVIRIGELNDSALIARKICQLPLRLYASPQYLEGRKLLKPCDLKDHQCLWMNMKEQKAQWVLQSNEKTEKVDFNPALKCDDFSVLRQLAQDHMGITELPEYMAKQAIKNGKLLNVLPEWHFDKVDMFAVYPSHRGATPKVRVFLQFLVDTFKCDT